MVSPFQAWLVSEIMANAASSINVLTERDQVMPPNSGFHLSLFGKLHLGWDQGSGSDFCGERGLALHVLDGMVALLRRSPIQLSRPFTLADASRTHQQATLM